MLSTKEAAFDALISNKLDLVKQKQQEFKEQFAAIKEAFK